MLKLTAEDIVRLIHEKTGLSHQVIDTRIEEKLKQLSGLISREGAAHIVANELNVKLFEEFSGRVQLKNLLIGMRSVEVMGKIMKMNDIVEFDKNDRKGKVRSLQLADETGSARLVLWNDLVDKFSNLTEGASVSVSSCNVKDNRGYKELHANGDTTIQLVKEDIIPAKRQSNRKSISQLQENDMNVEVLGTVVQVFDPRYFEVCNQCGKRARPKDGGFVCDQHGLTTPQYSVVLNTIVDDGTENMRTIFFANQAAKLLKTEVEKLAGMKDFPEQLAELKSQLLGNHVQLVGRVNKNSVLNVLEFVPQLVLEPNLKEEIARLEQEKKTA